MASMVSARLLTRADLDALPDDGLRHELLDGQFVMTPAPGTSHQTVAAALVSILRNTVRGSDLRALAAPFDVALGPHVVEPDLLVARKADFTARDLPVAPLLAVEILSPSTEHLDRGRKRDIYDEYGVRHYWIVDPEEPGITTYALVDGAYRETGHVTGQRALQVEHPFALRLTPVELLAD